jgi:diguanylate cyclase (GGDEF)-like protein
MSGRTLERVEQPRWRRASPGVAARILALALVPVIGLAVSLVLLVQTGRARLHTSQAMSTEITTLLELAELHRAMTTERLMTVGMVRLQRLGIEQQFIEDEFGVDLEAAATRAQGTAQDRLASLGSAGVVDDGYYAGRLTALRAMVDSPGVDPGVLAGDFDSLIDEVGAEIDRESLTGSVSGVSVDLTVGAAMARLLAAVDAFRFGALQLSSVSDVWFSTEATRPAAVVSVARYTGQFDRAISFLLASDDPAIEQWAAALARPDVRAFDEAVELALQGIVPENATENATTIESLVAAFGGAASRQDSLDDLVTLAAAAAETEAKQARDAATSSIQQLAIIGTSVAVLTVAMAVWSAYSITRPLRRLIERAERIRDGDLTPDARPLTGPPDLRLAAATVEQLVDNLRLLDAKSVALSRYDLDDPVLAQDLPGSLGRSLQQSTVVLRESITAREELQQRLWYAAHHDSLTGISNRSAAIEELHAALSSNAPSTSVAVLFLDLDDFKRANDAHGHAVGDEILRVTATRMRGVVRASDSVGRLGGDEFMIVIQGVERSEAVLAQADRLLEEIRRPIELAGTVVSIGASIGVAFAAPGDSPSDVLARADLAVYQAKQDGTSIHVYDEALHREIQTRTTIERDLTAALQRDGELELHYQPIVDAYSGELRRAEALLRWCRPGHGPVPPDIFIPAAEASSLIVDVDRWVLRRATEQAALWAADPGLDALGVSINVSGRHLLGDSFVATVEEVLAASGLDPRSVTLELTESVLLDDLDRAAAHLRAVRELGVRVHVDDFGTGYTSIAHLHALPIDGIKIDRRFIAALPGERDLMLVRTMVELGLQLGLTVVAEGVETEEQLAIVQSLGCESVQGFLIGRPCPADELIRRHVNAH